MTVELTSINAQIRDIEAQMREITPPSMQREEEDTISLTASGLQHKLQHARATLAKRTLQAEAERVKAEAERVRAEEAERVKAERVRAAQAACDQAEERRVKAKEEAERVKAKKAERQVEAEQVMAKEGAEAAARQKEAERVKAKEGAEEAARQVEAERVKAKEEAEEAARQVEAERVKAKEEAARQVEAERVKAKEEAARVHAEEAARQVEAERVKAEEAAAREQAARQVEAEQAARLEEAARLAEAARLEEAARQATAEREEQEARAARQALLDERMLNAVLPTGADLGEYMRLARDYVGAYAALILGGDVGESVGRLVAQHAQHGTGEIPLLLLNVHTACLWVVAEAAYRQGADTSKVPSTIKGDLEARIAELHKDHAAYGDRPPVKRMRDGFTLLDADYVSLLAACVHDTAVRAFAGDENVSAMLECIADGRALLSIAWLAVLHTNEPALTYCRKLLTLLSSGALIGQAVQHSAAAALAALDGAARIATEAVARAASESSDLMLRRVSDTSYLGTDPRPTAAQLIDLAGLWLRAQALESGIDGTAIGRTVTNAPELQRVTRELGGHGEKGGKMAIVDCSAEYRYRPLAARILTRTANAIRSYADAVKRVDGRAARFDPTYVAAVHTYLVEKRESRVKSALQWAAHATGLLTPRAAPLDLPEAIRVDNDIKSDHLLLALCVHHISQQLYAATQLDRSFHEAANKMTRLLECLPKTHASMHIPQGPVRTHMTGRLDDIIAMCTAQLDVGSISNTAERITGWCRDVAERMRGQATSAPLTFGRPYV
jgi:hypothetical protein